MKLNGGLILNLKKSKKGYRYIYILLFFSFFIFSRNTLSTFGLGIVNNVIILLFIIASVLFLFTEKKIKKCYTYIYIYICYCLVLFLISPLLSVNSSYGVAIIGITNLILFLPFWIKMYKEVDSEFIIKVLAGIGLINAVGALLQYFISPDIFGLVSNSIYGNPDNINKENVTKRAISFIASPQSLSIVLAVTFILIMDIISKKKLFWILAAPLVFISGVLTVSKAFFVFIAIYYSIKYLKFSMLLKLLWVMTALVAIVYFYPGFFERVQYIPYFLLNIESYSAFPIWLDAISYPSTLSNVMIGSGLGLFSRGAQYIFDYQVLGGSTESFILQLYLEVGVIGLLLFLAMITYPILQNLSAKREYTAMILSFVVVGLFAPSIYGFSAGYFFYSLLVLSCSRK